MGFGAFAGAMANSAMNTYQTIAAQQNRDALTKIQQDEEARKAAAYADEQRLKSDMSAVVPEGGQKYAQSPMATFRSQGAGDQQAAALAAQTADFGDAGTAATVGGLRGALAPDAAMPQMKTQTAYGYYGDAFKALSKNGQWKEAMAVRDKAAEHLQLAHSAIEDAWKGGALTPAAAIQQLSALDSQINDGHTSNVFQQDGKTYVSRFNNETGVGMAPMEVNAETMPKILAASKTYATVGSRATDKTFQLEERKAEADIALKGKQGEQAGAHAAYFQAETALKAEALRLGMPKAEIDKLAAETKRANAQAGAAGVEASLHKFKLQVEQYHQGMVEKHDEIWGKYAQMTPEQQKSDAGKKLERDLYMMQGKLGKLPGGDGKQQNIMALEPGKALYDPNTKQLLGIVSEFGALIPPGADVKATNDMWRKNSDLREFGIQPTYGAGGVLQFAAPATADAKEPNGRSYPTAELAITAQREAIKKIAAATVEAKKPVGPPAPTSGPVGSAVGGDYSQGIWQLGKYLKAPPGAYDAEMAARVGG